MKKSSWLLLLGVFIIFAFLRFYNLDQRIIFDWDQEQFSYQIKKIIEEKDLTLLGPRTTNDRGFFLGPYFTYLLVPFYAVTKLHPNALTYFIILYNIVFFVTSFYVIKKILSWRHALLFLLLWSTNYLLVGYDIIPWWPLLIPVGVVITWLALFNIYHTPSLKNYSLLGVILGFFSNMHFQFIFLILFSVIFLIFESKKEILVNLRRFFTLVFSFLIMFIPLLIFDLRHGFLNTQLFLNFFFTKTDLQPYDRNVWQTVFTNFINPLIYLKSQHALFLFFFVILLIGIILYSKKDGFQKVFYKSFIVIWLITPIIFSLYGKRPSEYYFLYSMPFILIAVIDFILTQKNKAFFLVVFLFVFVANVNQIGSTINTNPLALYYKDQTAKKVKDGTKEKNLNITFDMPLGLNSGFNYLFEYYGLKNEQNPKYPHVEIRNPPHDDGIKVNDAIEVKF